ncbi:hypothetical protein Hamer_G001248 [Homarus americanus]|uniref:Uncharacterized protein n=1 Tax=Homarus americanus TaxID=6706 RepID=A0A8J5N982_HOMAM|nr:hypothetical protein Hamer_G001248 [Homarus americanus]
MSTQRRYQTLPNLRALKRKKAKERESGGLLDGILLGALGRHVGGLSNLAGGAFSFLGGGGSVFRRREGSYSFYRRGNRSSSEDPLPETRETPRREKFGRHTLGRSWGPTLGRSLGHSRGHSMGHIPVHESEVTSFHRSPEHHAGRPEWQDDDDTVSMPQWEWMKVRYVTMGG